LDVAGMIDSARSGSLTVVPLVVELLLPAHAMTKRATANAAVRRRMVRMRSLRKNQSKIRFTPPLLKAGNPVECGPYIFGTISFFVQES